MVDADETKRPSRRGWPVRTQPTTTPAGTHDHDLPSWVFRAIVGMSVAVIVLAVAVGVLLVYVIGRGAYRDSEVERIEEKIRVGHCDLLDQLPEGGLLDGPRAKYHCGPGMPVESYPPEIQRQLRPPPTPPPSEPAPVAEPTPAPGPADPGPPSTEGASPNPGPPAEPPPGAPPPMEPTRPPDEPNPLLDLLCDATSVCVTL